MKNIDLGRAIPDVKVPSIQSYKINKSDDINSKLDLNSLDGYISGIKSRVK